MPLQDLSLNQLMVEHKGTSVADVAKQAAESLLQDELDEPVSQLLSRLVMTNQTEVSGAQPAIDPLTSLVGVVFCPFPWTL
jgi:hypothetical protein